MLEVDLGVPDMDVAQIDGQMVQESLHVGTLPIPGGEAVNGERVA